MFDVFRGAAVRKTQRKSRMLSKEDIVKIIEEHHSNLYLYCVARLKNKYDADDVISEVLLLLWTKKDKLTQNNIKAWLFRSANNCIKKSFRDKQKYNDNIYSGDVEEINLPHIRDNEYVTEHIERIDEKIIEYIKHQSSADEQTLFQYRYIDNMTLNEISIKMDIPYSTIIYRNQKLAEKIRTIFKSIDSETLPPVFLNS